MDFSAIEILAAILIVMAMIKLVMILINPQAWLSFIRKIYTMPVLITGIGFLLSLLVLYFIINSGISIIEVLAVCLFIALLMVVGLASYADQLISWLQKQNIIDVLKRLWLYSAIWLFLLIWGAYSLLPE